MSIRRAILKWVDVPASDPDDARRRRLLNILLLALVALGCLTILITLVVGAVGGEESAEVLRLLAVNLLGLAGIAVNYAINRRWNVWVGGTLFLSFLIFLTSIVDEPRHVIEGRSMFLFTVPIFMASVLLRPWTSFVAAGLSGIVVSALALTQPHYIPPIPSILGFFLVALAAWIGARSLEQALDNLRLSEQRYRGIFDAAQDAFLVFSIDGIIREANPAACRLHGYSHDELIGLPGKDIVHPDDHHLFEEFLETTKAGKSFSAEAMDVRKDGSILNINVRGTPYTFDREPHLLAVVRDTTEQKEMENLILAQRDLALALARVGSLDETLNLCLDAAIGGAQMDGGGIYLVDAVGGLSLTLYKGLSPEFAEATTHYDAGSPNTQLVMAGESVYASYRELCVPLSEIELREGLHAIAVVPVLHEGRVIACLNVISRSLSQIPMTARSILETIAGQVGSILARAQTEEALRKSEERYALAMDAATDGLFDWYMQTGEAYFSPRWYTMLGYEPDEMPASYDTWLDLLHPDDREYARSVIAQYNEEARNSHEIETRFRAKSGEWRWILSRGKIIERDPDGSPTRMVGTHVDITERKRLEAERRQATEALRALYQRVENVREEERRRLAKALHDDVMQRLVGVVYEVYNIDGVTDQDVNKVSEVVTDVGARCRAIVHNLHPPELDWPLAEAVRALPVGDIFLKIIPRVNPSIEADLPQSTKLIAYRVIQEAVNNAVKHAGALEITISLWLTDRQELRFEIYDNGCGFDPDTAGKEGHFGLTFMRERIEIVDGDLQIQSQPGGGTRVSATIPLSPTGPP